VVPWSRPFLHHNFPTMALKQSAPSNLEYVLTGDGGRRRAELSHSGERLRRGAGRRDVRRIRERAVRSIPFEPCTNLVKVRR